MVKQNRYTSRYTSRFADCTEIQEREVGRPKLRMLRKNPIVAGQLEYLVQPLFDFYGVAVATAVTKQQLFAQPIGASYTPSGGAAFVKTLYHTNLVQPGMLDAPKKMLVKAIAVILRSDTAPQDLNSFIGTTLAQLFISGKDYWTALVSKCPAGAGGFWSGVSPTAATLGTSSANGWPSAQNVATITDPMPQINFSPCPQRCGISEFSLIDLNPETGTRRKAARSHRERLSERTPHVGDATVCSHGNWNHERLAEMTNPAQSN